MRNLLCLLTVWLVSWGVSAQQLSGVIKDEKTSETVIGATVMIKGTTQGATTDLDGKFVINTTQKPPLIIVISSVGYASKEITINDLSKVVNVKLNSKEVELKGVTVTGSRVSEKQKEAPLTVESIDWIGNKQVAHNSFYEAL